MQTTPTHLYTFHFFDSCKMPSRHIDIFPSYDNIMMVNLLIFVFFIGMVFREFYDRRAKRAEQSQIDQSDWIHKLEPMHISCTFTERSRYYMPAGLKPFEAVLRCGGSAARRVCRAHRFTTGGWARWDCVHPTRSQLLLKINRTVMIVLIQNEDNSEFNM